MYTYTSRYETFSVKSVTFFSKPTQMFLIIYHILVSIESTFYKFIHSFIIIELNFSTEFFIMINFQEYD